MLRNYCFILVSFLVISQDCMSQLPSDLSEIAKKYNCSAVTDFFNRPGMLDPPYVYGYLNGEKENSGVFWCKNNNRGNKEYRLVIYSRVEREFQCSPTIDTNDYPGGLSLVKDPQLSLSWFHYLEDGKKGPNINVNNNFIQSTYNGAEDLFYCNNGKWLTLFRH